MTSSNYGGGCDVLTITWNTTKVEAVLMSPFSNGIVIGLLPAPAHHVSVVVPPSSRTIVVSAASWTMPFAVSY